MEELQSWVGKRLGKYKIVKFLGCVGMGAIYRASHVVLDRTLCVKILLPSIGFIEDQAIDRFTRIARTIARLNHPNIVHMYDIEEEDGTFFIVREYVKGKTLAQMLKKKEFFTAPDALQIGNQVAEALCAAHGVSIVHHALEPANILIREDRQVKLTDFGMNVFIDSAKNTSTEQLSLYLPPEYIQGGPFDHRVDMYSLGVILFHMLAGKHPYASAIPGDTIRRHSTDPAPNVRNIRPKVPSDLAEVIKRLMAKKPEKRFAETGIVLKALKMCAGKLSRKKNVLSRPLPQNKSRKNIPRGIDRNDDITAGPKPSQNLREALLRRTKAGMSKITGSGDFNEDYEETAALHVDKSKPEKTELFNKDREIYPVLVVIEGVDMGKHHILTKKTTVFGRSPGCDIPVKDKNISRQHCRITLKQKASARKDCKIYLEDLKSSNGTTLNRQRITTKAPLHDGDRIGFGSHTFGFYLKFKEELDVEMSLYKMATRDATTGLLSKTQFKATMQFEFKRSKRYQRPLVFAMMDIDHFKKINDSYGHAVGDEVLNELGNLLSEKLREQDTSVRYGGEEFAIFLPETDKKSAGVVIERLRQEIEKYEFKSSGRSFQVTASFGLAACLEVKSPEKLIEKADHALYQAKKKGRNRLVIA